MVTFDQVPYSEARNQAKEQGTLLDEIMRLDNIADRWDSAEVLGIAENWIAGRKS